ncbi:MAG TPA: isoprenylcysteine carboxylmethyltransferase family protein [Anaerolineales bacterium]|nr:isoprenylcysteine carboxylmethyltransferase family protein [Anaerolineales bacterium]
MMAAFFSLFQLANLVFFLAVFIGRSVILWFRQGINPFALGVGKGGLSRLLELLLLPWLALWMLAVVLSALHSPFQPLAAVWRPLWPAWLPIQILGMLAVLAGDALFVWALVSFGNSWRIGIDERSAGRLVTGGVFAFSRNPIFAFIDLYFLGTFLLNGSPIFLVFAICVILALHYQVLQEEKFLTGRYGQAYRDYCKQAGRYFQRR